MSRHPKEEEGSEPPHPSQRPLTTITAVRRARRRTARPGEASSCAVVGGESSREDGLGMEDKLRQLRRARGSTRPPPTARRRLRRSSPSTDPSPRFANGCAASSSRQHGRQHHGRRHGRNHGRNHGRRHRHRQATARRRRRSDSLVELLGAVPRVVDRVRDDLEPDDARARERGHVLAEPRRQPSHAARAARQQTPRQSRARNR